jgi:hypothetical protein
VRCTLPEDKVNPMSGVFSKLQWKNADPILVVDAPDEFAPGQPTISPSSLYVPAPISPDTPRRSSSG